MLKFLKKATPSPRSPTPTDHQDQSWLKRLRHGLSRTREQFGNGLGDLLLGKRAIDANLLEELENRLLSADVGIETSERIIKQLHDHITRQQINDTAALSQALQQILRDILHPCEARLQLPCHHQPHSILLVGINGVGKTTTIGKLTHWLQMHQQTVLLAAGDTFRAAAIEQLQAWGTRNQVRVIAQNQGSDSASVIYDALHAATASQTDFLLADTAGRLHTQTHLLEELKKVTRVMAKLDPKAPHDIWLVLDASIGQNALRQATEFHRAVTLSGLIVTKLDGTAKGGILFALAHELALPIYFIGVGEGLDDLRPFVAEQFVDALLNHDTV